MYRFSVNFILGVANIKRTSSEPSNITLKVNDELKKCTANRSHGNLKNISDHVLNQSMQSADSYSTTSSASSVGSSPAYHTDSQCGTPNDGHTLYLKNEKFIFASGEFFFLKSLLKSAVYDFTFLCLFDLRIL